MAMISIQDLVKAFGRKQVLHGLSFEVQEGEVFAFLGANGSGKTTTLRCLLGFYGIDSGQATVMGEVYSPAMADKLGYLPEERGLYLASPALEMLTYMGQLRGLSAAESKTRSEAYLERVGLAELATQPVKSLSSGQQQKIQLGITLLHRPPLLILDEPTKGLDPVNRNLLLELLLELKHQGTTILFSTHQMDLAERLADRLVMIKDGKRVLYGSPEEVKAEHARGQIRVLYEGDFMAESPLFDITRRGAGDVVLTPKEGADVATIREALFKAGVDFTTFELIRPSLDEIFVQVAKGASHE